MQKLQRSKTIQQSDYNQIVFQNIYNISGYSSVVVSNEIIDEIIDQGAKIIYNTYIDSKLPEYCLNFTLQNIDQLLNFNFWGYDTTDNSAVIDQELEYDKVDKYDRLCPFSLRIRHKSPQQSPLKRSSPKKQSTVKQVDQIYVGQPAIVNIPEHIEVSEQHNPEEEALRTFLIKKKLYQNNLQKQKNLQLQKEQEEEKIRQLAVSKYDNKKFTFDYNGQAIMKQKTGGDIQQDNIPLFTVNEEAEIRKKELLPYPTKLRVPSLEAKKIISNISRDSQCRRIDYILNREMNDAIYNNNNNRQMSMIPYINLNKGISITEITKFGEVTKIGEDSKNQQIRKKRASIKASLINSAPYNMLDVMNSDDLTPYGNYLPLKIVSAHNTQYSQIQSYKPLQQGSNIYKTSYVSNSMINEDQNSVQNLELPKLLSKQISIKITNYDMNNAIRIKRLQHLKGFEHPISKISSRVRTNTTFEKFDKTQNISNLSMSQSKY